MAAEATLLAFALAANDAHLRLAADVRDSSDEARYLVDEVQERLDLLVAHIRRRDVDLHDLHDALADRLNNLLMAIKTASDLLRAHPDEQGTTRVCEHLDATVESGRTSVQRLRDALRDLR